MPEPFPPTSVLRPVRPVATVCASGHETRARVSWPLVTVKEYALLSCVSCRMISLGSSCDPTGLGLHH